MSCDNQISTQDLINAKTDATTLGEVATSRAGAESSGAPITQSTNRFGEVADTVQGRLNKLGVLYDDPIKDWSAGLLVSDLRAHRYPATTGDIYIPVKPLPFTTGGAFNAGDWVLYNGFNDSQVSSYLINETSQAYEIDTLIELTSSAIVFPPEKIINTKGYNSTTDGGQGKFKATGVVSLPSAGLIDIISGDVYDALGQQFKVQPVNGRVTSSSMGLIPDGVTDYFVNGMMDKWLQYLSANDVTGVFTAGDYNCGIDQMYSNVSIHGEPGAVFAATIHIAINEDLNQPTLNRPKHVRWMGEAASYIRVGSWNCDDVYIERIAIYEDAAKAQGGFRAGGVHFFGGSKDMYIGDTYIQNSERSAALAVDYETGQTAPENIHFDNVFVESSYVHGVSFVGDNITADKITILEYGMGNLTDPNINYAVSQNGAGLTQAFAFASDTSGDISVGILNIKQNPAAPTGNGTAFNLLNLNSFNSNHVTISGSLSIGFQNNFSNTTIGNLVIENSTGAGIFTKSPLSCQSINVSDSGAYGLQSQQGAIFSCPSVTVTNSNEEGYINTDGRIDIGYMKLSNSNQAQEGFAAVIGTTGQGRIGTLEMEEVSSGLSGGVEFTGVLQGMIIDNIVNTNATDVGGAQFAGVSYNSVNGLSVNHMKIVGDNGTGSFQPLRLVGVQDININGANITNTFNSQIVAGVINISNNVGFMNCVNLAGSNISPVQVNQFNCVGMTT